MKYSGCNYWVNTGQNEFEPIGTATSMHDCSICECENKDKFDMCGLKREDEIWEYDEEIKQYLEREFVKLEEYIRSKAH